MARIVDAYFDFGSPNSYFCHVLLPEIAARTGAEFRLIPVVIGGVFKLTGNQPPLIAFKDVKGKTDYFRVEIDRFVRRHKLDRFRWNPHFPVNTLAAMRGAVAAGMDGVLAPYADALFRATWEDGKPMADPEAIRAVLAEAGLDADRLMARTQDPEVKAKLAENTSALVDRGGFGLPTFFAGDEMFFGKESLTYLEEAARA